jgi:MATE family multidrug resistance protein
VRVGLAYGAGDLAGVRRAGWTAYGTALVYACCTAFIMLTFSRSLVGVFLDSGTPGNLPVIDLAGSFLVFAGIFQFADAAQAVASGMLRGLGDTRVPMIYAAVGYWGIGLVLAVVLAFYVGVGGRGIWIGLATGLGVVALAMTVRWIRRERLGLTAPGRAEIPIVP